MGHVSAHDSRDVLRAIMAVSGAHSVLDPYNVEQIRQTPGDFVARNAILGVMMYRAGKLKQSMGALVLEKRGEPTGYYENQQHIEEVIASRRKSVASLASIACEACPLRYACGLGPAELESAIMPKGTRRRFRDRIRGANVKNTHFCATNLSPKRLRKAVA